MHIGDLLLVTPVLKTLRTNYPKAHIALLADAKLRDLVKDNKHIDELIEIDKKGYHNNLVDIKMKSIINRKYKILYINDLFKSFEYVSKAYNKKFHNKWNNFYELYDE